MFQHQVTSSSTKSHKYTAISIVCNLPKTDLIFDANSLRADFTFHCEGELVLIRIGRQSPHTGYDTNAKSEIVVKPPL